MDNQNTSTSPIQWSRCFLLIMILGMTGCEADNAPGTLMQIPEPRSGLSAKRTFSDYSGAAVAVSVNDLQPEIYRAQPSRTWTIDIDGINLGTENTISLRWFVEIDGISYDIATQSDTFIADPSVGSHIVNTDYVSLPFDHDDDNVSNLDELEAGGFPVPASAEPQMIPVSIGGFPGSPEGCFRMGSPLSEHGEANYFNEMQTEICNLVDFSIGRYEITHEQYAYFASATGQPIPDQSDWSGENLPVTDILWSDANEYTSWLSAITGLNYSLPTEAQWEYAARANTTSAFHTGQSIDNSRANFRDIAPVTDLVAVYYQTAGTENSAIVDGVFRFMNDGTWEEYNIDRDSSIERFAFMFEEVDRSDNVVRLVDTSRNIEILLALDQNMILLVDDTGSAGLLYEIVPGPKSLATLLGTQPVPIGSFPANAFGLQDMCGNVYEWTCSVLQDPYNGAEQVCVDIEPGVSNNQQMIKRGGSWIHNAFECRSANRGWNNSVNTSDRWTGFRIALNP